MDGKQVSRRLILASLFLAIMYCATARQDSLQVVTAKWQTKKLARGVTLKQYWFDSSLFNSSQNINILEIKMSGRNRLDIGADPRELKPTSYFGKEQQALAALNGTFFDMKNGGSMDYIRIDGEVVNITRLRKDNNRSLHQKAALVTDDGRLSIREWDGTLKWEEGLKGEDVMVSGPLLIKNGTRTPLDTTSMYTARHPRTAVAVNGKKVLLITVDGRNERAAGMSLYELASLLKWLGAEQGLNLDGGGSTTLWVQGFPYGGIINYPSDNIKLKQTTQYKPGMDLDNLPADDSKWDHSGERPVANVILVNKKK